MSRIRTSTSVGTSTGARASAQSPRSFDTAAQSGGTQFLSPRRAFQQRVQRELEALGGRGSRAALILLEVDANYLSRAAQPISEMLRAWHSGAARAIASARVDETRYAVLVAPIGVVAQSHRLAERIAHTLDPRVCPLLRRALPYAWWGVSVHPADGFDAAMLLAAAAQDLEQRRRSRSQCARLLRPRRRAVTPSVLSPVPAR
jgi:hypothetical protein